MVRRDIRTQDIIKIFTGLVASVIAAEGLGLGMLSIVLAAWRAPLCGMMEVQPNCLPSTEPLMGSITKYCQGADALPACSVTDAVHLRNQFFLYQYLPSLFAILPFAIAVPTAIERAKRFWLVPAARPQTWQWRLSLFSLALLTSTLIATAGFMVTSAAGRGEALCNLIKPPVTNATEVCTSNFGLQQYCQLPSETPACSTAQENNFSHLFLFATIVPNAVNNGILATIFTGVLTYYYVKSKPFISEVTTPRGSSTGLAVVTSPQDTLATGPAQRQRSVVFNPLLRLGRSVPPPVMTQHPATGTALDDDTPTAFMGDPNAFGHIARMDSPKLKRPIRTHTRKADTAASYVRVPVAPPQSTNPHNSSRPLHSAAPNGASSPGSQGGTPRNSHASELEMITTPRHIGSSDSESGTPHGDAGATLTSPKHRVSSSPLAATASTPRVGTATPRNTVGPHSAAPTP